VSEFNPRIYKNNRRAVRNTGEKTYVSMGVQSDYLPIPTYSGPVDPVDPVDDNAPISKRSRGRVAREYVPFLSVDWQIQVRAKPDGAAV